MDKVKLSWGFLGLAVIFDLFVVISVPFMRNLVNWPIIEVSFTNTTSDGNVFISPNTTFDGKVDNFDVVNLISIQFGLGTACFKQSQSGLPTNITTTCLSDSFTFGYTVNVVDFAQNTTTTLASSSTTVFLLVEIIALVITAGAIAAGVMQNKFYKYVPPVALIFTATALGVEDHLARKIESVAPNIGDDMVSTQRGCAFTCNALAIASLSMGIVAALTEK